MGFRVTDAWLRGGAGPMRDRRAPRGGARNEARDLLEEALEEIDAEGEESSQDPRPDAEEIPMSSAAPQTEGNAAMTPCSECHAAPALVSELNPTTLCVACAIERGPNQNERAAGMSYPQAVLEQAFDVVAPMGDWRGAIDCTVPHERVAAIGGAAVVQAAVAHFTATGASVAFDERGLRFRAAGYWAGPAA